MGALGKELFSIGKPAGYWIIPFAMYVEFTLFPCEAILTVLSPSGL